MKSNSYFSLSYTIHSLILLVFMIACDSDDPQPMTTSGISGTVMDQDDGAYHNVTVTLSQSGTQMTSVKTNSSGEFAFNNLSDGTYDIEMIAPLTTNVQGSNPVSISTGSGGAQTDFSLNLTTVPAYIIGQDLDVYGEIKNETRQNPQNDDALYAVNVFSNQELVPIFAPDGHQVTFDEWIQAQGTAQFSCNGLTSYFELEFTGLIPNGVYTMWIAPLQAAKTLQSAWSPDTDIIGIGSLGGPNGLNNIVMADDMGNAQLSGEMQSGDLSNFGELISCLLTSANGVVMILDYHIDGNTYGGTSGPDPTEVGHLLFLI